MNYGKEINRALAEIKAINKLARVEGRVLTLADQRRLAWLAWRLDILREVQGARG